ncbi:MAG: sterol desaturase family protein [Chitinophagales bacterium]
MKSPVFYAIPLFFFFMGIEAWFAYLKNKKWYRLNDSITNLSLGIGSQLFGAATKFMLLGAFVWIHDHYALFQIPATWWSFLLCLFTFDFLFYWAHRLSHEVNFLWGAHVVHHQSEEYNLSVALRQSWIHNLIAFFIFLPIPLLGFHPLTFGVAAGIDTLYQFWIHTKAIKKLPFGLEYILNTPSHHRVHHAVNPKYIDKNHAGVFIIWDRMFGTFQPELEDVDIVYGITTPFKSWNPAWANLHYYVEMWRAASKMTRLGDKLKMIVARPGWLPDYLGGYQAPAEPNKELRIPYDADTNAWMKGYAILQFLVVLIGSVAYLGFFPTISLFYKVIFFLIILISIVIIGAIFERKRWIAAAEYVRLILVLAGLNSFYFYWYNHWMTVMAVASASAFTVSVGWLTYGFLTRRIPSTETAF